MVKQNASIFIPLTYIATSSKWSSNITDLVPNTTYMLIVDYPLTNEVIFKIKTGKRGMSFISLLYKIGSIYKKIYLEVDNGSNKYEVTVMI